MTTKSILYKLFNIRSTEWPRIVILFLIDILSNTGGIWGSTLVYAVFVKEQGGLETLSWILVLDAALSILTAAIYTAFADRIANNRLLIIIYAFIAASIVLGLVLLWAGLPLIAYPILYLLFRAWLAARNPHFTTYVNSFYDTQSAKRVLPVISAGGRVGAIIAGLTMQLLTNRFASRREIILVIWLLAYLAVIGLVWAMPYLLKERKTPRDQPSHTSPAAATGSRKHRSSYIDSMREGFHYTTQSTYLRWMAIGILLLGMLLSLIQYRSIGLLREVSDTPEDLAVLLALLVGVGNLVGLPMLLFVMSRLIARLGLGNISLIFPTGNLMVCASLILAPKLSAVAAHIDRTAFRAVFHAPINGLLYNAVPVRIKGRVRAFVNGLVAPVGAFIGGLLLRLPLVSMDWFMSAIIGVLAVAYMISAWFIRQQYGQALVTMLEQEDYSFLLSQEASDLIVTDTAVLDQLQKRLEESTSHEFTVFIARLISQVGGNKAIPSLEKAIRTATDARTRSGLVDVIFAADLRGDAVRQLYTDLLTDPGKQVRQSAIVGLEQLAGPTDKQFRSQMLEMAQDPDIDVSVQALLVLVRSGNFYQLKPAVRVLDQLLNDEDPRRKAYGVRVLGKIGYYNTIRDLLEYLTDPHDQVRLEAVLAVQELAQSVLPNLKAMGRRIDALVVEKIKQLLHDPVAQVRQTTLIVLGQIGTGESHQALVDALTDPIPQIRATAVDALAQAGKSVIPIVRPKLDSPDRQLRKMATVVLGRIDPKEFGSLIVDSSIMENLIPIYRNYGLAEALTPYAEHQSIIVLQSTLYEQNHQLADEIFYLLTAIHDPSAIEIISESIRSKSPRARANATEALESLTTPQIAHLITPLFDPEAVAAQLLDLGKNTWDMVHPDTTQSIQQLASHPDDLWLRTITTYALGEIGATLGQKTKRKRARSPSLDDLFGALAEPSTKDQPPPTHLLTRPEIEAALQAALADPVDKVRMAAQTARQIMAGSWMAGATGQESVSLSMIEKVIFLKGVSFFQDMTVDQLKVLASACTEELFEKHAQIFAQGDTSAVLYVVISGRVAIERRGQRKDSVIRLTTLEAHTCFGEMALFDGSPRSASALALRDTLTLSLSRDPLIALTRQHPDLLLELINVLSERLRQANDRIRELSHSQPRTLQKLYEQFD